MNKNAIGLHKFSRIFRRGILQYFPHIPCRLQHALPITRKTCYSLCLHTLRADCNPPNRNKTSKPLLCLHTLRADCNNPANFHRCFPCALPPHAPCRLQPNRTERNIIQTCFASTRSVQIATCLFIRISINHELCLHTLRADCNRDSVSRHRTLRVFASTRSVQIATTPNAGHITQNVFASTRSVQIATAEMHRIAIYIFQNAC
jgi:hypothetical protein